MDAERLLTSKFLIRLVAIQSFRYRIDLVDSTTVFRMQSIVEIEAMVLEPSDRPKWLNENIYLITLEDVISITTDIERSDRESLSFDVDEVVMKRSQAGSFTLRFENDSVNINVQFESVRMQLLKSKLFEDGV